MKRQLLAKAWYDELSDEEREFIDILRPTTFRGPIV